jgi:hypothetical protein
MKKLVTLLLILIAALAVMAFQDDGNRGGKVLFATLTGETEVPGPGDPDGTGNAEVRIIPRQAQVCFTINVSNIDLPASAAHIHIASAGFAGPVVVNFTPPDQNGNSSGCVGNLDPGLLRLIQQSPSVFYVNVHNPAFPAGAVRGQLSEER